LVFHSSTIAMMHGPINVRVLIFVQLETIGMFRQIPLKDPENEIDTESRPSTDAIFHVDWGCTHFWNGV